jgi:hypothetical protein
MSDQVLSSSGVPCFVLCYWYSKTTLCWPEVIPFKRGQLNKTINRKNRIKILDFGFLFYAAHFWAILNN